MFSQEKEIRPTDVYTGEQPWQSFGTFDTVFAAGVIVRYCKKMGAWVQFTKQNLSDFAGKNPVDISLLIEQGYINHLRNGYYAVTDAFVLKCKSIADKNLEKRYLNCDERPQPSKRADSLFAPVIVNRQNR